MKQCLNINNIFSILFSGLLIFGLSFTYAEADDTTIEKKAQSPSDVVAQSLEAVKKEVTENSEALKDDDTLVTKILDENVMPYIDSKVIAKRVMGRYFRMASKEQKYAFLEKFKTSMVQTYANGLGNITDISYTVEETRNDGEKAQVLMKVTLKNGTEVPVLFSFAYDKESGKWYGENLDVAGLNLGLAYRDKFAADMQKYGNDIDQVIEHWDSNISK